jgi:hypothetical protein
MAKERRCLLAGGPRCDLMPSTQSRARLDLEDGVGYERTWRGIRRARPQDAPRPTAVGQHVIQPQIVRI